MNVGSDNRARSNPFATRFVRPGAIDFRFEAGPTAAYSTAAGLVARLAELGGWAQIVGPHGSGKSTLLASLLGPLDEAGRRACVFALRDGQRRMPAGWARDARRDSARLIMVDGYEQLGRVSRLWLKFRCRTQGWGLLVTAHAEVGFATLFCTTPSLEVAQAVVEELLPPGDQSITRQAVAETFAAAGGDLRETLFALYDQYEGRRAAR